MGEMVERIAEGQARFDGWDGLAALGRVDADRYRARARLALEAMKDPTEAMQRAGFRVNVYVNPAPCGGSCVARVTMPANKPFEAMIEAALAG